MQYNIITEMLRQELAEANIVGWDDRMAQTIIKKYETLLSRYRKIHPFRYILIQLFPKLGQKW